MNQNFNDPVNQVAGRDINNYVNQGLTERDLTEKQLNTVIEQETAVAKVAWKEIVFHPYNIAMIAFPFLLIGVMGVTMFTSYLPFTLTATFLALLGLGGFYCTKQKNALVQGEIGAIYRQAKTNIRLCKAELTRRRIAKKALGQNRS